MARIETDPNYTAPTFSRATAATDLFKKEDVQNLAAAVSTHVHDGVHGLALVAGSIPAGSITSAMIADATIDTADLKDSAVTSAKILDGTIATADLANSAVTNAKLGADTARANLLTNGGFEIWQRGNGPFTASGAYSADRWLWSTGVGGTVSITRDQGTVDLGSSACAAIVYTHGSAASNFYQTTIDIYQQLRGKTVTFSCRVKTNAANAVRMSMNDGVTGGQFGSYHTGNNQYQTLTQTYNVATNATQLNVAFNLEASCTTYFDNAMLVVGSVAADYAPLHPADDLARCRRYYEVIGGVANTQVAVGWVNATSGAIATIRYTVPKPVTPTVTIGGVWRVQYGAGTFAVGTPSCSPNASDFAQVVMSSVVGSPLTVGQAVALNAQDATSVMSVEANP